MAFTACMARGCAALCARLAILLPRLCLAVPVGLPACLLAGRRLPPILPRVQRFPCSRHRQSAPSCRAGSGSAGDRSCSLLDASVQDALRAYGPLTAGQLEADFQLLGFSGATVAVPRLKCGGRSARFLPVCLLSCTAGHVLLRIYKTGNALPLAGHGCPCQAAPSNAPSALPPPIPTHPTQPPTPHSHRCSSGKDWTESVQRLYLPRMQDLLPKADALGPLPLYHLSAFVPQVRWPCFARCRLQQRPRRL